MLHQIDKAEVSEMTLLGGGLFSSQYFPNEAEQTTTNSVAHNTDSPL